MTNRAQLRSVETEIEETFNFFQGKRSNYRKYIIIEISKIGKKSRSK